MATDGSSLIDAPLSEQVIGAFYAVFRKLGHGFLESVYERALVVELRKRGLGVERQALLLVEYDGQPVGRFRADLVVEGHLLVELKAARAIEPAHEAQLINYLRAADLRVGLLFNFGVKPEFKRFVGPAARRRVREHCPWPSVPARSARSEPSVVFLPPT